MADRVTATAQDDVDVDPSTSSTPDRLLAAAERLIARHGVDGTSVRAVNVEASSNVAAVHYHFGSKEGLVTAVLERRMGALGAQRAEMLEAAATSGRPPDVRAVAEAMVLPLARLAEGGGQDYVGFLASLERAGDRWWGLARAAFQPQAELLLDALARAMPEVDPAVRGFRFTLAAVSMQHALATPERLGVGGEGGLAPRALVQELVDVVVGALAPPARDA